MLDRQKQHPGSGSPKATSSPDLFDLSGDDVHIWQASLAQPEKVRDHLSALLTPEEHKRAARFYFERDRQRFGAGRGMLRLLLGDYLRIDPVQVRFSYSERGKPSLAPLHDSRLTFNLAHSEDKVVYMFTLARRAGIDLEFVRPMPDEDHFAALYYSARENTLLKSLPAVEKTAAFFKLWTCKEAYLKAVGTGLAGELTQVEVELSHAGSARFLSLNGDITQALNWKLELFTPWDSFQAALAMESRFSKIASLKVRDVYVQWDLE